MSLIAAIAYLARWPGRPCLTSRQQEWSIVSPRFKAQIDRPEQVAHPVAPFGACPAPARGCTISAPSRKYDCSAQNTDRSPASSRTGQIDPKRKFPSRQCLAAFAKRTFQARRGSRRKASLSLGIGRLQQFATALKIAAILRWPCSDVTSASRPMTDSHRIAPRSMELTRSDVQRRVTGDRTRVPAG